MSFAHNRLWQAACFTALAALPTSVLAADTIAATEKQATNWTAIVIFGLFVVMTLPPIGVARTSFLKATRRMKP